MNSAFPRIAIIGGGPSGLTAALRLQQAGVSVVVFEARERVGGRTSTDRVDGFRVDAATQLWGSVYTRLFGLLRELGLESRLVRSPGRDALWRGGRAHEVVYGSVTSMLASGGLPLGTKMRLGTTYVPYLSRHADALDMYALERAASAGLDRESIADWGRREIGRDFVEYLVYPLLAAYYGSTPEETTAALYHLLARQGMNISVYALQGGAGEFCEALAAEIIAGGGEVRTSTEATAVEVGEDRVQVSTDSDSVDFDAVVVSVPAPVASRLISGLSGAEAWLDQVRYRPALSLALLLDRPVGARYFGLSFPREESRSIAAVCVEENKGADLVPEGRGLLVAFASPMVAPELVEAEGRRVLDAMLPDLERVYPRLGSLVERAKVYRWTYGSPVFYPGYLQHLASFRNGAVEGSSRLALAGDYLHAPTTEGAVTAGERAAERLLRRL